MDGTDATDAIGARHAQHGLCGFRRETQSPIGAGDPVTQLMAAIVGAGDAAAADQARRPVGTGEGKQAGQMHVLRPFQKSQRVFQAIGAGHARQVAQDGRVANGLGQGRGIFHPARTQEQAGGTGEHSRLSSLSAPIAANDDGLTTAWVHGLAPPA